VPRAGVVEAPARREPLERVLAHDLPRRVACARRARGDRAHEPVVDEAPEHRRRVAAVAPLGEGDVVGGVDREPAHEHAEIFERAALRLGEELPRAVEDARDAGVARGIPTARRREDGERAREPLEQLGRAEHGAARGRHLEREGHALEQRDDAEHERQLLGRERAADGARAILEQPHRRRRARPVARDGERREAMHDLAGDPERHARRREHDEGRGAARSSER
jgi:hypothetical protein